MTKPQKKQNIKPWMIIITSILLIIFLILVIYFIINFTIVDRGMVINRLDNETLRFATTLFFNKMSIFTQLAFVLLGGMWAFLFLKETKVNINNCVTITCFILANISFLFSLFVYAYGYDFLVGRIFYNLSFDIDAPFVQTISKAQQYLFYNGCLDLIATIFLGRHIL